MALLFESHMSWAPTLSSSKPVTVVQEFSNYCSWDAVASRRWRRGKTQGECRIGECSTESLQNFREVRNVDQKS